MLISDEGEMGTIRVETAVSHQKLYRTLWLLWECISIKIYEKYEDFYGKIFYVPYI